MKIIILLLSLIFHLNASSEDKEGDLQLSVSDVSLIEKQKEELPPTIEEVEIIKKEKKKKNKPEKHKKRVKE